jgi:protein TonB
MSALPPLPLLDRPALAGPGPGVDWSDGLPPLRRRVGVVVIAGVHVLMLWGLMQLDALHATVREMAPLMVSLVVPPAPTPSPPPVPAPPRASLPLPPLAMTPQPPVTIAEPPLPVPPPAAPAITVAVAPMAPPMTTAPAAPAPPAPVPPPPPAPPQRKTVPASAVEYLVMPAVEVPRLSRRAGEHGTVLLRVLIDVRGLPVQVTVLKSSGHPRLDDQAVSAMRRARFKPQTHDGVPVELLVDTPIEYLLE